MDSLIKYHIILPDCKILYVYRTFKCELHELYDHVTRVFETYKDELTSGYYYCEDQSRVAVEELASYCVFVDMTDHEEDAKFSESDKQIPLDKFLDESWDEIDLFEYPNLIPHEIMVVLDTWDESETRNEEIDRMLKELKPLGYEFDYDMDNEPHSLKKIRS